MAGFGALWGNVGESLPEAYQNPAVTAAHEPILSALTGMATLPKRALDASQRMVETGEYDPAPAVETAMNVIGSGASFARPGTLGVGGGRMIQNADLLKELANQRRAQGMATGKSAPGWDFKRPDAPAGSPERAAVEARAAEAIADPSPEGYLSRDDEHFIQGGGLGGPPAEPVYPSWYDALKGTLDETRPAAAPAELPAAAPAPGVGSGGGGPLGAGSLPEAQAKAARWAGERAPLEGLPGALKIGDEHFVPGPIGKIHNVAEDYMREHHPDRPYEPPTKYQPIDPEHSKAIAQAYEDMPHTPDDPATKASYEALIDETAKQYEAIKRTGLKMEPIPAGAEDPYAANPRLAAHDVAENNHLWYFPTEGGFGTVNKITDNPMLRKTGEMHGDHELLANDMFRIVHDYFGHLKEGHGFRAAGEDNAWRTHSAMYSDIARPAMTTETRGQNSWVNYGPHGEKNRKANAADTTYADQKVGLMPEWTMRDRGSPDPIIAYHGTPHSFDHFNMDKIGAGEGNQAYGHGLYFAENEPVSEWYRHQLAARRDPILQRHGLTSQDGADAGIALAGRNGDHASAANSFRKYAESLKAEGRDDAATTNMIRRAEGKASYLEDPDRAKGHMYQIAIDAKPEHFLNWDAALSGDQQEMVRKAAQEIKPNLYERIMGVGRDLNKGAITDGLEGKTGEQVVGMLRRGLRSDSAASEALRRAGIPGIKYLDQGSRSIVGKPTHNYVTFDDRMVKILRKYGLAGMTAAGGAAGFGSLAPREEQ